MRLTIRSHPMAEDWQDVLTDQRSITVSFRTCPAVKELLSALAIRGHRSLSQQVELMLYERLREMGLASFFDEGFPFK